MQEKTFYSVIISGTVISLIGRFLGVGFQFISQILLARYLGPIEYGQFSIGWSFFQLIGIIAAFGFDYAIIKFGSKYWDEQLGKLKSLTLKFNFLALIGTGLILLIIFAFLGKVLIFFNKMELLNVFQLFAIGIPFYVFIKINSAATRITNNMQYSVFSEEVVRRGLQLLFVFLIINAGLQLKASILATILSFVIAAIVIGLFTFKLFFRKIHTIPTKIDLRSIFRYSIYVTGSAITASVLVWFDRIILGLFQPAFQVGLYQSAIQVTLLFPTVLLAVNIVMAPLIVSLHQKNDMEHLKKTYRISTRWILYLAIPLALLIFTYPEFILTGLYGEAYSAGKGILLILTISQLFNIGTGVVTQILILTGHEKKWFWYTFIALLINVSLNVLLIPIYGGVGTAVASGLALIVLNLLGLFSSKTIVGVFPYEKKLLKGGLAAIGVVAVLLASYNLPIKNNLATLLLLIIFTYSLFILFLFLLGFDSEDKNFIQLFTQRMLNQTKKDAVES